MPQSPRIRWWAVRIVAILSLTAVAGQPAVHGDDAAVAFLKRHCVQCHSGDEPKGDLRLNDLSQGFSETRVRETWLAAVERVQAGEMPPEGKPRPPRDEVESFAAWVAAGYQKFAAAERAVQGRTVLRRLNRVEYENTIRDLLAVEVSLQELLPPDTASVGGFDNSGRALHTSSHLMERYLEAADKALSLAIANGPQPPKLHKRLLLRDQRQVKGATERVFRTLDDAVVMFSSSPWSAVTVNDFYPPDRGQYRVRISASGFQSGGQPVTLRVDAGPMLMGTKNHLVGYFNLPPDEPTVIEFVDHFEARSTIRILPYGLATAQTVNKIGADEYDGPGLAVQWIEIEGPLHDAWPPESHRRIFGDMPQAGSPQPNASRRVEVVSDDPAADARRILRDFARRAFRRPVGDDDLRPFVALFESKLAEGHSFEQAVRVGLVGVLVSPDFLFLRERPGRLDDFALASRLSYFLWSTMPDEELLALAEQGTLHEPDALRGQVERMLASPKSRALTENFVGQWLNLRDIDFTEPDRRLYPEFDELLKTAMVEETYAFFDEVLRHDLSLTNFVASDFAMLNERLARHYGVDGASGHALRRVELPPGSRRGGVLSMGSVLKVTANGTVTSPVVRGTFVLDRILGQPPQPPPAGVPAIEPDIRGAVTIREQLSKHREVPSCASCHARIDPLGFALESYDVIGGWRERYRTVGRGEAVVIEGRRMPYLHGPAVDPADVLADGRAFDDIDGLKARLLEDKHQLARALATRLTAYATGQAPDATDQPQIDQIVARIRDKDYGLRSLVHEIVQSELFLTK